MRAWISTPPRLPGFVHLVATFGVEAVSRRPRPFDHWKVTEIASEKVAGWPMGWRCQYWKFQVAPGVMLTAPAQGVETAFLMSVAKVPAPLIWPTSLS